MWFNDTKNKFFSPPNKNILLVLIHCTGFKIGYYDGSKYREWPSKQELVSIFAWTQICNIQKQTMYPLSSSLEIICNKPILGNYIKNPDIKKLLDNIDLERKILDSERLIGYKFNEFIKFIGSIYGNAYNISEDDLSYFYGYDALSHQISEKEFIIYLYKRYRNIDLNGCI